MYPNVSVHLLASVKTRVEMTRLIHDRYTHRYTHRYTYRMCADYYQQHAFSCGMSARNHGVSARKHRAMSRAYIHLDGRARQRERDRLIDTHRLRVSHVC